MPWEIVQSNSGTTVGTGSSQSLTLPSGTTADNTVLICLATSGLVTATPSGFTLTASNAAGTPQLRQLVKAAVAAETSWSFTASAAVLVEWAVFEVAGLDNAALVDVTPQFASTGSGTTVDTAGIGTNNPSSVYDGLVVAAYSANIASASAPSFSGYGQGLVEQVDVSQTSGSAGHGLAVAMVATYAPTVFDVGVTVSPSASAVAGVHVVYAAAGAKRAADLLLIDGAEQGTVAGLTASPAGWRPVDFLNGAVTADAAAARTGSFGWRLVGSGSAANFGWNSSGAISPSAFGTRPVFVRHFRLLTLPAADTVLWTLLDSSGTVSRVVRFLAATGQIGVKVGAGTEQVSVASVAANTWFRVDLRLDMRTTTHTVDWQLDGVEQTQVLGTAGAGAVLNSYTVGPTAAGTFELHTDDGAGSGTPGHYPLGDIRVYPLLVDPAGTVAVSGTTSNFGVMTGNATVAAWNAANAKAAVDDVPPTIGASADGVVAVTASATDYVEFPMQTRDAAANGEAIRGIKAYFPLWAAAATAATIRLQANDGVTTYVLFNEADPGADNSTTAPVWVAAMLRGTTRPSWTQAKLDALVLRFGSNDATPDIGVHAVLAEVAMRAGEPRTVIGTAGDVTVATAVDPDSGAVLSATLDAAGVPLGGTLQWVDSGGAGSQPVAAGASFTETFPAAVDVSEVTWVEVDPDPDPDQPG